MQERPGAPVQPTGPAAEARAEAAARPGEQEVGRPADPRIQGIPERRSIIDRVLRRPSRRPQGPAEPVTQGGQPVRPAGEARAHRRHSRGPLVTAGLAAVLVAGGVYFRDDIGRAKDNLVAAMSGIGKDGSNTGTSTPSSAAADAGKAKAEAAAKAREKEIADAVAKAAKEKEQADAKAKAAECPPGSIGVEAPLLGEQVVAAIPVPSNMSEVQVTELSPSTPEGRWLHPIYIKSKANAASNWEGVGSWYPIAYRNVDANAATLETHNDVGMVVVQTKNGGRVEVAFSQLFTHQDEGKFDSSQNRNDSWNLQYTFHGLKAFQEIRIVDPDTGRQMLWPDGSTPVIYKANEFGTASFELPKSCGDVRVGFVFQMFFIQGFQLQEVKVQRGPNDRPDLQGENPLPRGVVKAAVPGQ